MIDIESRMQSAAESILENETLTADLDDTAAKVLLDWGVGLSQQIANQTIELDQSQAEEAMYPPMRALRKMLRGANMWSNDPQESNLGRIFNQAAIAYGSGFVQPGDDKLYAFTTTISTNPSERLIALQELVEGGLDDRTRALNPSTESDTLTDGSNITGDNIKHIFE